jgi:glutamate---cysteine ligase / carboxylate-amine ligase
VAELSPVAARLGCLDELTANLDVLDHGPSYRRQRAIVDAGGTLTDVVDSLVVELDSGKPGAAPA